MIAEDVTPSQRMAVIEALLFCNPAPMRVSELEEVCGWERSLIERDLDRLVEVLEGRGIELQRVAGAVRLVSTPQAAEYIERMLKIQSRRRLSRSQLETLAVVAYKQPVTRAQVESYRGVKSERPLSQLMELRLIREVGRAPLPGRPCQYGTTAEFLRHFGMNDLKELPVVEPTQPRLERGPFCQLGLDDSGEERLARELSEELVPEESSETEAEVTPLPFGADSGEEPTPGFRERSHLEGPSAELKKLFEKIRKKNPS